MQQNDTAPRPPHWLLVLISERAASLTGARPFAGMTMTNDASNAELKQLVIAHSETRALVGAMMAATQVAFLAFCYFTQATSRSLLDQLACLTSLLATLAAFFGPTLLGAVIGLNASLTANQRIGQFLQIVRWASMWCEALSVAFARTGIVTLCCLPFVLRVQPEQLPAACKQLDHVFFTILVSSAMAIIGVITLWHISSISRECADARVFSADVVHVGTQTEELMLDEPILNKREASPTATRTLTKKESNLRELQHFLAARVEKHPAKPSPSRRWMNLKVDLQAANLVANQTRSSGWSLSRSPSSPQPTIRLPEGYPFRASS